MHIERRQVRLRVLAPSAVELGLEVVGDVFLDEAHLLEARLRRVDALEPEDPVQEPDLFVAGHGQKVKVVVLRHARRREKHVHGAERRFDVRVDRRLALADLDAAFRHGRAR
jgi:hypothetical protein